MWSEVVSGPPALGVRR